MLYHIFKKNEPHPEEQIPTFLISGLGNPGRDYHFTRHNIGFMAVDRLAEELGVRLTRFQSKAIIGSAVYEGKKVIFAKPQTYMNLSGQAVAALIRFYKIPLTQFIVINDDMDLPLGTLRIRPSGGSAGQKGVASIIERLGTQDFARMRLGIGRPQGAKGGAGYVLQEFSNSDKEILTEVLNRAAAALKVFITSGIDQAMNQFNGTLEKG